MIKTNNNKKGGLLFVMIGLAFLTIFSYFVIAKLVMGGRWSTGMVLGGFDNWMAGGTMYTTEGLSIGSVYSPGSLFLAIITRPLFGYSAETAIIVIGGLFILLTLWAYASLSGEQLLKRYVLFLVCIFFFIIQFPWLRGYALEMHPDVPCLMFFVWGVFYIGRYLKNNNYFPLFLATVLLLCSGLFKANALFLFVGLCLYVLFSPKLVRKQKIAIILSEMLAGIGVLVIMLSIDGCLYNSVIVMSTHPFVGANEYLTYINDAIKGDGVFILLLFVSILLLLRKKIGFKSVTEKMWVSGAALWFLFGIYGAAKVGSNCGNIEASLVALIPVVLPTIEIGCNKIYQSPILKKLTKNSIFVLLLRIFCLASCVLILIFSLNRIEKKYLLYQERIEYQTQFSNWLNTHYSGRNIAYSAIEYELLNGANVNKKTDFHIAVHYLLGDIISDKDLKEISRKEGWDLIIITPSLVQGRWPHTFEDFVKLDKKDYPAFYVNGELVEVYVKNKEQN